MVRITTSLLLLALTVAPLLVVRSEDVYSTTAGSNTESAPVSELVTCEIDTTIPTQCNGRDNWYPVSVVGSGVFCTRGPVCSGNLDEACPGPQKDLPFGSYCAVLGPNTDIRGCFPNNSCPTDTTSTSVPTPASTVKNCDVTPDATPSSTPSAQEEAPTSVGDTESPTTTGSDSDTPVPSSETTYSPTEAPQDTTPTATQGTEEARAPTPSATDATYSSTGSSQDTAPTATQKTEEAQAPTPSATGVTYSPTEAPQITETPTPTTPAPTTPAPTTPAPTTPAPTTPTPITSVPTPAPTESNIDYYSSDYVTTGNRKLRQV